MSITLELTPQEEELIRDAASERGQSVESFARDRLLEGMCIKVDFSTEWAMWSEAGRAAGRAAVTEAFQHGIGVVYSKDGAVVEETADGTIRVLHPATS